MIGLRAAEQPQSVKNLHETKAASAKKDTAMMRSAVFSRASGSLALNCQATTAAEVTSMTESSPNPTNAEDEAIFPAVIATTASMTL